MSSRSSVASRRPNRVLVGASATEAVLDIRFPFLKGSRRPPRLREQFMYTRCQYNHFVCIAAIYLLQCNLTESKCRNKPEKSAVYWDLIRQKATGSRWPLLANGVGKPG